MNAFEALAKLDSSNVMAIRVSYRPNSSINIHQIIYKEDAAKCGIYVASTMFEPTATWEVAYVCENCSGNGAIYEDITKTTWSCPECHGDKMIWSDK